MQPGTARKPAHDDEGILALQQELAVGHGDAELLDALGVLVGARRLVRSRLVELERRGDLDAATRRLYLGAIGLGEK